MQQIVGRGERHFPSQVGIERALDLAHYEHPARLRLLEKRCQERRFLLARHVLATPATACTTLTERPARAHEASAQPARPTYRHADG